MALTCTMCNVTCIFSKERTDLDMVRKPDPTGTTIMYSTLARWCGGLQNEQEHLHHHGLDGEGRTTDGIPPRIRTMADTSVVEAVWDKIRRESVIQATVEMVSGYGVRIRVMYIGLYPYEEDILPPIATLLADDPTKCYGSSRRRRAARPQISSEGALRSKFAKLLRCSYMSTVVGVAAFVNYVPAPVDNAAKKVRYASLFLGVAREEDDQDTRLIPVQDDHAWPTNGRCTRKRSILNDFLKEDSIRSPTNTSTSQLHYRRALHPVLEHGREPGPSPRDRVSNSSSSRITVLSQTNQSGNVVTNERQLFVTRNSINGQMTSGRLGKVAVAAGHGPREYDDEAPRCLGVVQDQSRDVVLAKLESKIDMLVDRHSVEDEELDEVVTIIKERYPVDLEELENTTSVVAAMPAVIKREIQPAAPLMRRHDGSTMRDIVYEQVMADRRSGVAQSRNPPSSMGIFQSPNAVQDMTTNMNRGVVGVVNMGDVAECGHERRRCRAAHEDAREQGEEGSLHERRRGSVGPLNMDYRH
ncbi:hypothetical protein AYO21_09510 [Fonsecaea monophora]|uniref:Uncharacterized protein n=1 Tax=Fonsecaea monophora TaxID=254056 RepID=A0A177EWE2_9EURO|nr:hypothetical protein AYO21_09510 [Fonsecaea monophora]OAG36268.1 hypothetical protein AYO21_09510 [Fonsecaea monophora]